MARPDLQALTDTPRERRVWRSILAMGLACAGLMLAGAAQAQVNACGTLKNHYGPFDYRTDQARLPIVEEYHFTPQIEALLAGKSSFIENDLAYTLHAFPNHHRALVALTRLGQKTKSDRPGKLQYSIECYYERALRFRPDDVVARMLYAEYLIRKPARRTEALAQLRYVREIADDNPLTHYNAGLLLLQLGQYDEALAEAHTAIRLGMQRQELTQQLKAAGKWREPSNLPIPARPAASAASAP